ncbi:MAG: glycosyltransferase family 2 protein [Gemmatimonadota bacterium]|nr:glycosyltransferase family 2 protein [Gemmatimonadota bacterium]
MPRFSIVIPTYNRRPLLSSTLDSVAAQVLGDWECLVCDDGSTDDTHEYVRVRSAADPRIRLVLGPRFGLPAGPRNRGIREARAEWIAFCDDDDVWHPSKLKRQDGLLRAERCDAVSTVFRPVPEGAFISFSSDLPSTGVVTISLAGILLFRAPYPAISTNVVRRARLLEAGGFSEAPAYRGVEDMDLWARLVTLPGFCWRAVGGDPLVLYRDQGGDSISAWNQPLRPDVIRQRWATLDLTSRMLAAHSRLLAPRDRREVLVAVRDLADDCAARSVAVGWRKAAVAAYAWSAALSARVGAPGDSLLRGLRLLRFGMLGRARSPAPMPPAIQELRISAGQHMRRVLQHFDAESLLERVPPP